MAKARALVEPLSPSTLDREVTDQLLADIDVIALRMARQIADVGGLPAEFRRVGYLRTVVAACRDALRTLVRLLRDGQGLRQGDLDRLGSMGAHQAELGVPLELLLAAYRLAAKVVWREVIGEATRVHELPPKTVIAVTEQVLEYLDEISAAVGAAYLQTRERLMRVRDRNRDRVLQRLIAGEVSADLRQLAAAIDLNLAPPYRVIAYRSADHAVDHAPLDDVWRHQGALVAAESEHTWLVLLPERADARAVVQRAAKAAGPGSRLRFALGPVAVTLEGVGAAAARTRNALAVGERLEPGKAVHDEAELGIFAVLATDQEALQRFAAGVLGELATSAEPRHVHLRETLAAILDTNNMNAAARTLGVHRHTVVYRLRRLAEMGIDPGAAGQRPRLWLALQALRLRTPLE